MRSYVKLSLILAAGVLMWSDARAVVSQDEEEEKLVARVYDVTDLPCMLPRYPATRDSDLDNGYLRKLFGDTRMRIGMGMSGGALNDRWGSTNMPPVGGGMGMEGMEGMKGMGMFNMNDPLSVAPDKSRQNLEQAGYIVGGYGGGSQCDYNPLQEAIQGAVAPNDWIDVGGLCSMSYLETSLLVSAPPEVHEQIDAFLTALREHWGTMKTVSVRAHWVWLTEEELTSLLVGGDDGPGDAEEMPAFGMVDADAWKALFAKRVDEEDRRGGYHSTITCNNRQTVHTVSGGQRRAVISVDAERRNLKRPDKGSKKKGEKKDKSDKQWVSSISRLKPMLATVQEGAALEITPTVSRNGKFVAIDVQTRVIEIRDDESDNNDRAADDNPAQQVVSALDRPRMVNYRFATKLRLPVGRRMLVGGMTYEGRPEPGEPGLYLFLKTSLHEFRDDKAHRSDVLQPSKQAHKTGDSAIGG